MTRRKSGRNSDKGDSSRKGNGGGGRKGRSQDGDRQDRKGSRRQNAPNPEEREENGHSSVPLYGLPWAQERLAQFINDAGTKGMSRSQLTERLEKAARSAGEPELPAEDLVGAALPVLARKALVTSKNHRWFDPATLGLRQGRVERTGSRFFRIRDLSSKEPSFFEVDKASLSGAGQGDIVLFEARETRENTPKGSSSRERRHQRRGRRSSKDEFAGTANVSKVVEHQTKTWVGLLKETRYGVEFQPFDHRLRFDARELDLSRVLKSSALSRHSLDEGVYVSLRIDRGQTPATDGRSRGGHHRRSRSGSRDSNRGGGRATSLRIIGRPSEPNIETKVVLAHFGIPDEWPRDIDLAPSLRPPKAVSDQQRRDLRTLTTFTIDGATARDFDDALTIRKTKTGFKLWVHIADVSHYVRPGSAVDAEAQLRGTSVYFADRAVHMLPAELSEDLCSLKPDVDRFAMTVEMNFDHAGERVRVRAYPSHIRSDARLTYSQVQDHFDGKRRIKDSRVARALATAKQLAEEFLRLREERGVFEIDQDVGAFTIGEDGMPEGYRSSPRVFAHRLIEEFMIQANVAVATLAAERSEKLQASGVATPPTFLFRRHDPPKLSAMVELAEEVKAFGIRIPDEGLESIDDLARLLDAVEDKSIRSLVEGLLLRSLKRAFYTPEQAQHFGLALDSYCHFTSPIRRYPDLVDHRWLKVVLFGDQGHSPTGGQHLSEDDLAEQLSVLERRADQAEREQFQWRMVRWLKEREGETFEVTVTGVQPFGLFVMLDGYGMDGLIPFDEVPGGDAEVTTEGVEVEVEKSGATAARTFRLGDRFEAVLAQADVDRRQLMLSLQRDPSSRTQRQDRRKGRGGSRREEGRKRSSSGREGREGREGKGNQSDERGRVGNKGNAKSGNRRGRSKKR